MNRCRLWFKRRPLLLLTTHFNLSLMFSFFPPPFYFLAEELILIVALQQGSLHPGEQPPVCRRASQAARLGAAHRSGHILMAPLPYKAWIVFHVILVNFAAGKGIGFPCELLIRLPQTFRPRPMPLISSPPPLPAPSCPTWAPSTASVSKF